MYISTSLQFGFDHGFALSSANNAPSYTKFIYELGNSVKITPRLAANIDLDKSMTGNLMQNLRLVHLIK